MKKALTAYFSASGKTRKAAEKLANYLDTDLCEIVPAEKYTKADLNWMNKNSRSSLEMKDPAARPAIAPGDFDVSPYEKIYLGFPIWWYTAPRIIDTFLEAHDFSGKTIVLFATSGTSGLGKSAEELQALVPGAKVVNGLMLNGIVTEKKLKELGEIG